MQIRDLAIGDSAKIVGYAEGNEAYRARLLSMGLTKNALVKLIKIAPLGDPVEIEIRGFRLSLRKNEADILLLKDAQ